jgi:hypothetical protein
VHYARSLGFHLDRRGNRPICRGRRLRHRCSTVRLYQALHRSTYHGAPRLKRRWDDTGPITERKHLRRRPPASLALCELESRAESLALGRFRAPRAARVCCREDARANRNSSAAALPRPASRNWSPVAAGIPQMSCTGPRRSPARIRY